jgi:hypothetical protein
MTRSPAVATARSALPAHRTGPSPSTGRTPSPRFRTPIAAGARRHGRSWPNCLSTPSSTVAETARCGRCTYRCSANLPSMPGTPTSSVNRSWPDAATHRRDGKAGGENPWPAAWRDTTGHSRRSEVRRGDKWPAALENESNGASTATAHRLGVTVHDPWALFDTGIWVVFVAWAIAIHLCQSEPT